MPKATPKPLPQTPQEKLSHAIGHWPPPKERKHRKRPRVKGHPGVERGSPAASDLFWAEVSKTMERVENIFPASRPFGFDRIPSPSSEIAKRTYLAWKKYERDRDRERFMRIPPEDRERIYWHAVDHAVLGNLRAPDPYIFGFDEIPSVRPATFPEDAFVREIREARAVGPKREAALVTIRARVFATLADQELRRVLDPAVPEA